MADRTYEQGLADGRRQSALAILDHLTAWTPRPRTPLARAWNNALRTAARIAERGSAPPGPESRRSPTEGRNG